MNNRAKGDRTKTRNGIEREYKIGNYRISKYRMDFNSNISSVRVSCYCSGTEYTSISRAILNINRLFGSKRSLLEQNGLKRLIFVPELSETCLVTGDGFCDFTIQFNVNWKFDKKKMEEPCYMLVADTIIDIIGESKLVVLDK